MRVLGKPSRQLQNIAPHHVEAEAGSPNVHLNLQVSQAAAHGEALQEFRSSPNTRWMQDREDEDDGGASTQPDSDGKHFKDLRSWCDQCQFSESQESEIPPCKPRPSTLSSDTKSHPDTEQSWMICNESIGGSIHNEDCE